MVVFSSISNYLYDIQSSNLACTASLTEIQILWYNFVIMTYMSRSNDFVILYDNYNISSKAGTINGIIDN